MALFFTYYKIGIHLPIKETKMTSLLNKPFTNGLATDYTYRSVISRVQSEGMASGDRTGTGTKGTCFLATDYLLTGASVPLVSSKNQPQTSSG
jgi:hypothetical protein